LVGDGKDVSLFIRRRPGVSKSKGMLIGLLTGINRYQMGSNLNGCVNDVNAYVKFFRSRPALFGKPQLFKLIDKEATAKNIRKNLERLANKSRVDDLLLFHFSGHMAAAVGTGNEPNAPRTTLVTHEYKVNGPGELPLTEVIALLSPAKAKYKVIILD
jgi:hypothetical protein